MSLGETLDMSKSTISAWANSTVKQYDAYKLALFYEFFGVGIEDVLIYEER